MDKYYTPEIEEFCVGFEFEKHDEKKATYKENNFKPTNWHRKKHDLTSIRLSQLPTHLHNKTIRVKYLDKYDIESLGFIHSNEKVFELRGSDISLWWNFTLLIKSSVTIRKLIGTSYINVSISPVKNLSELKVLLKKLKLI